MNQTLKDSAVDFLTLVASGNVEEAFQKYAGDEFKHHNPFSRGDKESLARGMKQNAYENPNKSFDVKRVLQEGEFVIVHSHIKQNMRDFGAAVVHILRFEDNLIAELWDVGMAIPGMCPNENGVF